MILLRRGLAVAALLGIACSGDGPTGSGSRAASVVITDAPTDGIVMVGAASDLGTAINNSSGAAVTRPVQWSSSSTSIATVSAAGVVTGVAAGPVLIVARADDVADTLLLSVRVGIPMTGASAGAPVTTSVLGGAVTLTSGCRYSHAAHGGSGGTLA